MQLFDKLQPYWPVIAASLVVIVSILTLSILLSVLFPPKKAEANS